MTCCWFLSFTFQTPRNSRIFYLVFFCISFSPHLPCPGLLQSQVLCNYLQEITTSLYQYRYSPEKSCINNNNTITRSILSYNKSFYNSNLFFHACVIFQKYLLYQLFLITLNQFLFKLLDYLYMTKIY